MRSRLLSFLIITTVALSACIQVDNQMLEKNPPAKKFYTLEANRIQPVPTPSTERILRIAPFRIASTFHGRAFIYRFDEHRYQSDYYHQFFTEPGRLITAATEKWLSASGRFALASSVSSHLGADLLLEGTVDALYGDFRQPQSPQAVIELHLRLLDTKTAKASLIFHRRYHESLPFESGSAENLVKAWNQCLADILRQFEQDIASYLVPKAAGE